MLWHNTVEAQNQTPALNRYTGLGWKLPGATDMVPNFWDKTWAQGLICRGAIPGSTLYLLLVLGKMSVCSNIERKVWVSNLQFPMVGWRSFFNPWSVMSELNALLRFSLALNLWFWLFWVFLQNFLRSILRRIGPQLQPYLALFLIWFFHFSHTTFLHHFLPSPLQYCLYGHFFTWSRLI